MTQSHLRCLALLLATILLLPAQSFTFETPLSDTAVREAYFLGQRHDEKFARFLDGYNQHLPEPKTGPNIATVSFLTPFALLVQQSASRPYGYSAQQAQIDHRGAVEKVKVVVVIRLTDSYPAFMPNPYVEPNGSSSDYLPRPGDFWRDFRIQVRSQDKGMAALSYSGAPDYVCGRTGDCILTGATVKLEFPAEVFTSDSATVEVDPPEGDPVTVDFDISSLK